MTRAEFLQTQHQLCQTVTQKYAWPGGYPLFAERSEAFMRRVVATACRDWWA